MDDVGSHGHMVGGWHIVKVGLVENALVPVRELVGVFIYIMRQAFAITVILGCTGNDCLVHPASGFLPHTESTVLYGGGDMLRSTAKIGQFKVMDAARTVPCKMGNVSIPKEP